MRRKKRSCIYREGWMGVRRFKKVGMLKMFFFLILTRFNTHYEPMRDSIYCSERCASVALFSYLLPLFPALYTVTVPNARTL